jgi:hypothetical protein
MFHTPAHKQTDPSKKPGQIINGQALSPLSRYTAHAADGTLLYSSATAQTISDAACNHNARGETPPMEYTHDHKAGVAYPFMVWRREHTSWVGHPFTSLEAVKAALR